MNDLISRQAAIDEIYMLFRESDFIHYNHGIADSLASLHNLSPAQQWIPVSERLPKEEQNVLVTRIYKTNKSGRRFVDTAEICCSHWLCDSDEFLIDKKRVSEPIAWMPMPEPYKEIK